MKKIHKNRILLNDNGSYMQQQIEIDLDNELVELNVSKKMSIEHFTKFCIMVCKACSEANEQLQKKVINNLNKN